MDRRFILLVISALLGTLVASCAAPESAPSPRLSGGAPALPALAGQTWDALVRSDTAALDRLRLSEYEHNELVWPEQPAARAAGADANLEFWWSNIQIRNRAAQDRLLRRHAGSAAELVHVSCPGAPRQFRTFRALTDCRLVLEGPEGRIVARPFRHVVEMDGVYKVVRYYAD